MKDSFKIGFGLTAGMVVAFTLVDSAIRAVNLYFEEKKKPETDSDMESEEEES